MPIPIYQVDAFADRPFTGNPAAVVLLDAPCNDTWMQQVAAEMNLAETAFVLPEGDAWRLRWFTPAVEVDLCGHATLATAHTLWESGRLPANEMARFNTRSGLLTAARHGDAIELDFPLVPVEPIDAPSGLADALGARPQSVGCAGPNLLALLDNQAQLQALQPDFRALRGLDYQGVIVTAQASGSDYDFVSRYFAPAAGVDEDPVTGSAHCALAPFWSERLGREQLLGYQASQRGGYVHVRVDGDRVRLGGTAVTVLRGSFEF